jgi:hypothetical protein
VHSRAGTSVASPVGVIGVLIGAQGNYGAAIAFLAGTTVLGALAMLVLAVDEARDAPRPHPARVAG